jgi:hypothetical protein
MFVSHCRLQRAQEERSRRNPTRYYDDAANEPNSIYRNDAISNLTLSPSRSSYVSCVDHLSYMPTNAAMGHPNAASLNSFIQHPNMLATINGTTATHVAYYSANPVFNSLDVGSVHSSYSFHFLEPIELQSRWCSKSTLR